MNTLKITQHNDFVIYLPLVVLNTWGAEAVNSALITDIDAKVKQSFEAAITPDTSIVESFMVLKFDETLKIGRYDAAISFKYEGRDVAKNIKDFFCIVEYDQHSNWRDYIIGDHVITDTQAFIAGAHYTDAEYEQLKQQLTQAIEQVEEEKAEWQRKIAELTDVAKETKATENKEEVLQAIGNIPEPDLSALAKEATLNTKAQEILTKLGNTAQQGDNAQATNSAIYHLIEQEGIATADEYAAEIRQIIGDWTN